MRFIFIFALLNCTLLIAKPSAFDLQTLPISKEAKQNFNIQKPQILEFEGQKYKILIATNKDFSTKQKAKAFYLLDANRHFPLLLNNLASESIKIPVIIVGIGYETTLGYDKAGRTRDYTPKVLENVDNAEFIGGGGEGRFFDFLSQILKPQIQKTYPNIDESALFGHSFGGLFTLNALLNHALIFDAYFIASPSIWWDNASFIPKTIKLNKCPKILITKGELEKNRHSTKISLQELILRIKKSCKLEFKEFKNENHGSVISYSLVLAFKEFIK